VSATDCFAVGVFRAGHRTLIERWNGTTWSIVASPNPAGAVSAELHDVTCLSATSCFAVGEYSTDAETFTLIQQWNGSSWSLVPSPNPESSPFSELSGVARTNTTNCFAVGSQAFHSLIERWNGTAWSIVESQHEQELTDVSCPISTRCFAVGVLNYGSAIETWDGTSWSLDPTIVNGSLQGVSCVSTTNCIAVGNQGPGSTLLTMRWNGTTWSEVTAPSPGSGPNDFEGFYGAACGSATTCFGVGGWRENTLDQLKVLIERWSGAAWSIVSSAQLGVLRDVSCASATSCVAVGERGGQTFTMRYG
jgi:hypothetical protein